MSNPEQPQISPERSRQTQESAAERSAELLKNAEKTVESSPEGQAEQIKSARHETEAAFSREAGSERSGHEPTGIGRAIKRVTNEERQIAYKQTMSHIRSEMSAPARNFSKFIHQRGIERASGVLATSVARPNAILSGSTCALILVTSLYVLAKIFGYPLSGFETIGAFALGWALGLIYDYVRALVTGGAQS